MNCPIALTEFDKDTNVVWSRMVDQDAWEVLVRVDQVFQFKGTLEIWDNTATSRVHIESVYVPIEAFFGKEVPDWDTWQTTALNVIDNSEKIVVTK